MAHTTAAQSWREVSPPAVATAGPVALRATVSGRMLRLAASGSWTVRDYVRLEAEIGALQISARCAGVAEAEIDLSGVVDMDTAGALLTDKLARALEASGISARISGASGRQSALLAVVHEHSAAISTVAPAPAKTRGRLLREAFGGLTEALADAVQLTAFLGATTVCASRTALRPWRFRWISFLHHIEHVGLRAAPIISLICLLIGAVITQQGIVQLREFQAEPLAVDMLGILALREVGILLTAIIVAGRSASAFTAEIGSMKMREEIDAMRTLGLDPMELLVLPRIAALIVILPLLAFIGDLMCLAGGGIMALIYLDVDLAVYMQRLHDALTIRHFAVGLVKAPLIAVIIGLVGCREGLTVRGSAESLGRNVTGAVVKAIFLVIVFDALFAMFLSASGF